MVLLLAEIGLEIGLFQEVATNIDTNGTLERITNLEDLKIWLHRNNLRKAYLFDEANEHLGSRRAMTNKSVSIIEIFPEISKARAILFMVGQDRENLDSELRKRQWVKAVIEKISKKIARIISPLLGETVIWRNIPPTSIKFDPYALAPFTLKPVYSKRFKDEDLQKLSDWANGKPWKELFKHPQECNRFVRSNIKKLLLAYAQYTINSVEGKPGESS
jgi:hypothetical protein